jgi:hypothetical protein
MAVPPHPVQQQPGALRARPALLIALVLVCVLPVLMPGDAPWIGDEPNLIGISLTANQNHRPADGGLVSQRGVRYGPLPCWIYQVLLLISHNPIALVVMRAALVTIVTAASLIWLSRTLRLWPWFTVVLMLSPYLWFYSRLLWDNSFCIPLGALTLAAYAAFLQRRSAGPLCVTVAGVLGMPLIHLMGLGLAVPVVVHMLIFQRSSLRRHARVVVPLVLVCLFAAWPYWSILFSSHPISVTGIVGYVGWWFPLFGARLLGAGGLDYFFGEDWLRAGGPALSAACLISLVAYPMVWVGMVFAVRQLAQRVRRGETPLLLNHIVGIVLAAYLTQTVVNGLMGISAHPHYYNGTWIVYAILAWLTADALAKVRFGRIIVLIQGVALAGVVLFLIVRLHQTGGARDPRYGPTLANQIQVARELRRCSPDSTVTTDVYSVAQHPEAFRVLNLLSRREPQAPRTRRSLSIRYRSTDPTHAHIEVQPAQDTPDAGTTQKGVQE